MRSAFVPLLSLALPVLCFSSAVQAAPDGATVFNQNCAMCHVPGLANAPKLGDKEAWAPRLKTGRDALMHSALNGKGAMPARGGNPRLSDEEVGAAVSHLMKAGAAN